MKQRTIVSIFLAVVLVFPVFAEKIAMPPIFMPAVSANGFGGHHVAYTDNVFSLMVNPGAMVQTRQRSILTLAPSLYNPQFTFGLINPIMNILKGDASAFGNMANTLSAQNGSISLGFEINEFPLSIAWVANGFGFGIWNRSFVNVNIADLQVEAEIYEDVMIPVGFAFKIFNLGGHTLDAGLVIKPFARVRAYEKESIQGLIGDPDGFIDKLEVPIIAGGNLDLGLMYRWNIGLSAGFTVNNIFSHGQVVHNIVGNDTNQYYVPMVMNLGLAYELQLGRLFGLVVAADWRDMANAFKQDDYLHSRNLLLDFGIGAQLSLFNFVYFRIGMNEMLPAAGVGIKLGALNIDLAYYGKELGFEPGQRSAAVLEFSFSIRPEAKKRDWPWARNAIIGNR